MTAAQLALPVDVSTVGEIVVHKVMIPFLPPSKNQYDGWPNEWKWSAKRKWMRWLSQEFTAVQLPTGAAKVGLGATLVFPTARGRDLQNYANCLWNWVPDALVKYGAIPDDTPQFVEFGRNLGLTFAVDGRRVPEPQRRRTHLAITMLMAATE